MNLHDDFIVRDLTQEICHLYTEYRMVPAVFWVTAQWLSWGMLGIPSGEEESPVKKES